MKLLQQTKIQLWILTGCCLLMIFIVRPWELYFLNDDFIHIPMDIRYLFERGGFMRPVPNVFLELDKWLYGKNALGFFSTTLLMHSICVFCVYAFCRKLITQYLNESGLHMLPLFAAVLFCFYPFHTEALMWTISRVATIATTFTILSLHFYLTASERKTHALLSWIFFVIALFTYESMWNVLLLFLFMGIANYKYGKPLRKEIVLWLIFFITFLIYLLIRVKVLSSLTGDGYDSFEENATNIPFLIANWFKVIARVFTPAFISTKTFVLVCASLALLHSIALVFVFKRDKKAARFILVLIAAIITGVATASILGIDTHRGEADRYLHYASVFYCMMIAVIILILSRHIQMQFVLVAGILVLFIFLLSSYQQNFSKASAVTRTTVKFIQQNKTGGTAYFVDVPKASGGALIFRVGLDAAVDWMSLNSGYKKIVVLSQTEQFEGNRNFTTGDITSNDFAVKNNLPSDNYILKDSSGTIHLQKEDIVFWFTKDAIRKVNPTNK